MIKYLSVFLLFAATASADTISFTGDYAHDRWTRQLAGGYVATVGTKILQIRSANTQHISRPLRQTQFVGITMPESAWLSFDWAYNTNDYRGPQMDPFGWMVNGTIAQLTVQNESCGTGTMYQMWCKQRGNVRIIVRRGDTFAFWVDSVDSSEGNGIASITNFSTVTIQEPEPSSSN